MKLHHQLPPESQRVIQGRNPYPEEAYFYHMISGSYYGKGYHIQVAVMLARACHLNVLFSTVFFFLHVPKTKQEFSIWVNKETLKSKIHFDYLWRQKNRLWHIYNWKAKKKSCQRLHPVFIKN